MAIFLHAPDCLSHPQNFMNPRKPLLDPLLLLSFLFLGCLMKKKRIAVAALLCAMSCVVLNFLAWTTS